MSRGLTFSQDFSNANIGIVGCPSSGSFSVSCIPSALIHVLAEITFSIRVTTSVSRFRAGLSHAYLIRPQAALLDFGRPHWVD